MIAQAIEETGNNGKGDWPPYLKEQAGGVVCCTKPNPRAKSEEQISEGEWERSPSSTSECRYQSSFSANCTCREVVEVPVMAPAVPETPVGVKVINAGVLKFARFARLKISARN